MSEDKTETTSVQPAAPAAEKAKPGTFSVWPGAFGLYKYSKDAVMFNLQTIILIWLAGAVISAILQGISKNGGGLLSSVVSALLSVAYVLTYLASIRGKKVEPQAVAKDSLPMFLNMFLLNLLVGLVVIGGLILFIVPGIIFAIKLSLAPFYLVDQKMGVMDAFKASWNATKGNMGILWGIVGASIVMFLPALTIIGIPVAIYFLVLYSAALAYAYDYISKQAPVAATTAPAAPAAV
jgi:hypothetical protein